MKIIYTAIFGDYDELQEPLHIIPDCRYICYTDTVINSKHWELKMIKPKYDSVRSAREVKWLFHLYNPFFEGQAMWVDANQQIISDISLLFERAILPITLLKHPDRECIYTEAIECMRLNKDDNETINIQIAEYIRKGFPAKQGLVATGMMIRQNNSAINKVCEQVFEEIRNGSRRDQLCFNYIAWKQGIGFRWQTYPFNTLINNFKRCNHKTK